MNQNEMIFCRACGKQMHQTAFACPSCGAPTSQGTGKSKTTAAVLAFFFGGFGVHRFYLGQWWGLFYLLFSLTFIPSIIAFIEFIVFLCTSNESWGAKYGPGRQQASSGGLIAIVVIVGGFVGIAMIGILAAIALPAYQDYTVRARLAEAYAAVQPTTVAIGEYYMTNKQVPPDLKTVGVDASHLSKQIRNVELNPENGILTVYVNTSAGADASLLFTPEVDAQGKVIWTCSSETIRQGMLPHMCRKN
ncbi:NINE protein [Uliginosibacterium gangwonense]|uniref:NINE protein n=1 Tax=Uliginosibacterium gangwonense TaxID=392736 RepID=UPI00037F46C5|nr:NINE protein [Uliginosibacterium gangwonense]